MQAQICPFCGSNALSIEGAAANWWVNCDHCLAQGPVAISQQAAYAFWNGRDARNFELIDGCKPEDDFPGEA
jgi:hypothetical protein